MMLPMRTGANGALNRIADLPIDRSPFVMMDEVRREMDRMFDQVLGSWSEPRATGREGARASTVTTWIPSMDVEESGEEIRLHLEVPGISAENLHVDVTGDVLTITGERTDEHRETDGVFRLAERRTGRFERRLTLPEYVAVDSISATCENGVLLVTLPKRQEVSRQRRIEVRNANRQTLLDRGSNGGSGSTERERAASESADEATVGASGT
ncbi:MAG TPA: Hsp20/alpha crystallin family protein [Gemmatimonadales bacterium]